MPFYHYYSYWPREVYYPASPYKKKYHYTPVYVYPTYSYVPPPIPSDYADLLQVALATHLNNLPAFLAPLRYW